MLAWCLVWYDGPWLLGAGSGSEKRNFQKLLGGERFGSVFYIIYIFIYFDAYLSTKACRMLN